MTNQKDKTKHGDCRVFFVGKVGENEYKRAEGTFVRASRGRVGNGAVYGFVLPREAASLARLAAACDAIFAPHIKEKQNI